MSILFALDYGAYGGYYARYLVIEINYRCELDLISKTRFGFFCIEDRTR